MATTAFSSHGTVLRIGDGAAGFATVGELLDMEGPEYSRNMHDVTPHNETDEQFIAGGVLRTGTVTFTINYNPAGATHDETTGLLSKLRSRLLHNWEIIATDTGAAKYAFAAWVQNFRFMFPVDGVLRASITLKITGAITITP
jgi:hypothetical protein